jgi:hypothetical protein
MKSRLVNNSDKSSEMLKAQDHAVQAELTELQPQLVTTVGEVEALMARVAAEKRDVVEPKAAVRFTGLALTRNTLGAPALRSC